MGFADSYLGRLRARIGSELVLMPGAMVVVQRPDGRVLFTRRADDSSWGLPAGAAEPGGSFTTTAVTELREETGLVIRTDDLVAFGSLSEARLHTIRYPNGDLTHCFALLFLVRRWVGEPRADGEETTAVNFREPTQPPEPLHAPTQAALELLARYETTQEFQTR